MNPPKKLKILFISSWYPNKLEPTNGNFVQRHAEAVALVHSVEVLHAIGDFNQKEKFCLEDQPVNGIRTLTVYYRNSRFSFLNFFRRMQAYRLGYRRMQRPDLVHGNILHNNMLFAVYLKKRYHIPFVISEHWSALQEMNHHRLKGFGKALVKFMAKHASAVMPVSENLSMGLRKLGITTPLKVIGNVVDTERFNIGNKKAENFVFLHISNLIPLKNPDKIIEAAVELHKKHQNFELHIGGDGDEQMLKNWVSKYRAEAFITTFGLLSSQEVAQKIKNADCFVLFSDNETQGIVVLESFACGIPVIASEVGGIPEILNSKRGVLVEKGSQDALVKAMKDVLENNITFDTPQEIRDYCTAYFSKETIAVRISEVYHTIISP